MSRKRKPRSIHVHGKRWFERTNGNTYHSVKIWVDGKEVYYLPFDYGYGSMYMQNAQQWLSDNGYLKNISERDGQVCTHLSMYCRENGINLVDECDDVPRKKDL